MSKHGFTRELLRQKGFVMADGKLIRVENPPAPPPRLIGLRPAHVAMNRVETRLNTLLRRTMPIGAWIQPQFRIRITSFENATKVHYTADFAVWTPAPGGGWTCRLWEAKDAARPYHSDELTRPKLALEQNPWIRAVWQASWHKDHFQFRQIAGQPEPNPMTP